MVIIFFIPQGDSYEKVGYTLHLTERYKSMILVSLKVFMVERTIFSWKSIFLGALEETIIKDTPISVLRTIFSGLLSSVY